MKITFILPNIAISGGTKAVFEFANHLYDRDHDVSVLYPLLPMRSGAKWYSLGGLKGITLGIIENLKQRVNIDWFDLKGKLIRVPSLSERYMPDADIIVATWWETAYYVSGYNESKGEKFYLAQHYEIWGGPKERVNNSYKLGLRIVVNSNWLRNMLQDMLGVGVDAMIPHAPDLEQFYPQNARRSNDTIRILMAYRDLKWKGMDDGIKAFEIVREKHPDTQLVMFGANLGKDVPEYAEYYEKPSNFELRGIYNSCDLFVFPSISEGFGMPPMEAMACKCAVVATAVGAVPDYSIPGETALICPPNSPQSLAENILKLVEDRALLNRISEAGYYQITKNFSWDKATEELEQTFKKALSENNHSVNEEKDKRG